MEDSKGKKGAEIILHKDYKPYIDQLTPEQAGALLLALMQYQDESLPPVAVDKLDPVVRVVLMVITDRAAREKDTYENIVNRNRENGNKGGRPKNSTSGETQENPDITQENPEKPRHNPEKPKITKPKPNPNPILPTEVKRESRERKAPTPRPAPTLEEVKAYAAERKSKVNPESFFLYHQGIGWKKGNNPIEDWKAIFQQWEVTEFDKGNPIRAVPTKKNGFHFEGERKTDYDAILREEQLALAEQIRAAGGEP